MLASWLDQEALRLVEASFRKRLTELGSTPADLCARQNQVIVRLALKGLNAAARQQGIVLSFKSGGYVESILKAGR